MKLMSGLGAAVFLAALAGCGASNNSAAPTSTTAGVLPSAGQSAISGLRESADYTVFAGPEQLMEQRSAVYVGVVDAVLPGRVVDVGSTMKVRESEMVVRISVEKTIRADTRVEADGKVYVSMHRASEMLDADGQVSGGPTAASVEEFGKALGVGTRVVVIGQPAEDPAKEEIPSAKFTVVSEAKGVPADVSLIEGNHPQTLTFDQGEKTLDEWPGLTFEEFLTRL